MKSRRVASALGAGRVLRFEFFDRQDTILDPLRRFLFILADARTRRARQSTSGEIMRMMILCVCVLGLAAGCSIEQEHLNAQGEHLSAQGGSAPKNLEGLWLLEVENLRHKTITTATIRFTDEKAPSCLGEGWKRVVVESHDSSHEDSFPVTGLLSYEARGNALAIGHNEVCDAYVHLEGEFKGSSVEGNYVTFGWGREHLGYFSLRPITE